MQALTVKIRIFPDQPAILRQLGNEYIRVVNQLTKRAEQLGAFPKMTTKDVETVLPSAVCNQAIRDAKSVFSKIKKLGVRPILKKSVYFVNNQNYTVSENTVAFPIVVDKKTKKTAFRATATSRDMELLRKAKLGLMRIIEKSGKWYAQIPIEVPTSVTNNENIMGIDLGLKVPAVSVTSTGKTRFFGNGRENKYIRRKYQQRRRKLGKLKKLSAIRKLGNKEQRWMKDQNHKISRQIVDTAIQEGVSIIKLERLENIRKTARTSRKNAKNLHSWTFYQLQQFISYKANLVGIKIVEVNPAYTSQTCPACAEKNKAKDRGYECSCGFNAHRDRVGAINIMNQPVADGNSLSA
ncbi:transposase [Paenibacillus larvae subsp. larvae]|uniref:Transposase n=3 Tax=Paenibacillus larvae TaxID=1464 RepID=A0A2L1UB51_9BACL|nr:RNA-guided endonuclease TnpB family protein [Paenibacillus larvae]AQT85934.1 transposase [Paenibacillus larvae subsp. pulvifaciens]AQZ45827.1 transposase [Paenibacillus larvae subsp. pulvifaciens]AVF25378.1 transposase [Paenibacillus larvae subsp. larvae]AVF30155.1 transposase [Paenibacillus larvae subsp. larvae]MDR5606346.1 transposase [Paenibacillus larvae]